MSAFKPEQFFAADDIESLGMAAEAADLAWLNRIDVERLEADGVIQALGVVLRKRYETVARAAAQRDEYFLDDAPYRYDGDPERLIISQAPLLIPESPRAMRAWITLKTEGEDEDGQPCVHYEGVGVARIDTELPWPEIGFSIEQAWSLKEICQGREQARTFGILPHLNASLDGLTANRDIVPADNIQLGEE